jgi:hypothetical protein
MADKINPDYMVITVTNIGRIDHGIDGSDQYLLLSRSDANLTAIQAHKWLMPQVYRETYQEAGGYFCKRVTVMRKTDSQVVAIVHHEYDV